MAFLIRIAGTERKREVRVEVHEGDSKNGNGSRSIDKFPRKGQGNFIPPLIVGLTQKLFMLVGKGAEATKVAINGPAGLVTVNGLLQDVKPGSSNKPGKKYERNVIEIYATDDQ